MVIYDEPTASRWTTMESYLPGREVAVGYVEKIRTPKDKLLQWTTTITLEKFAGYFAATVIIVLLADTAILLCS